jgi:4-amino-4-deoxy-L-arabinose transferase-like glycosyltransferase
VRTALAQGSIGSIKSHTLAVVVGALAAILAARVLALWFNATDLFFDEAQYWGWSLEPAFGYYSKPPLIAWIIGGATGACGTSEFCIRLPSPLIHSATAVFIYMIGRGLYDASVGMWSALTFTMLPGVSVSAGIISTDVPLLLCWAVALWGFIELVHSRSWWPALVLGVGVGLGLNAKYAMAFFPAGMAVAMVTVPAARQLWRDPRIYAAGAIGALLIAPNLVWNLSNGFATFAHTADNARWGGSLLHIGKGLEFLGAQFGVFGPILFAALLWIAWQGLRGNLRDEDRLLLAFALPVLLIITAQAFISRAHANWAATAYVAGSVLVVAVLLRKAMQAWLVAALALHVLVFVVVGVAASQAGQFRLPIIGDPFARTLGWRSVAQAAQEALLQARQDGRPFAAVITDDRSVTAELLYYLRHDQTPIMAWRGSGRPQDHYELTRPYHGREDPVLLISVRADAEPVTRRFERVQPLGERQVAAGADAPRRIRLFSLSGLKP